MAKIWRSAWPTITALNYAQGREFHVRLRQHKSSGVCLVYGSVHINPKNRDRQTIFAEVIQRGRLCRSVAQVHQAIEIIKQELGIEGPGKLPP